MDGWMARRVTGFMHPITLLESPSNGADRSWHRGGRSRASLEGIRLVAMKWSIICVLKNEILRFSIATNV
jgi:hypothetical protein